MKRLAAALLLCCGFALAEAPPVIAIRNAKIVTVSGPVIAKGTVIVRNGLIEAVGENVAGSRRGPGSSTAKASPSTPA